MLVKSWYNLLQSDAGCGVRGAPRRSSPMPKTGSACENKIHCVMCSELSYRITAKSVDGQYAEVY